MERVLKGEGDGGEVRGTGKSVKRQKRANVVGSNKVEEKEGGRWMQKAAGKDKMREREEGGDRCKMGNDRNEKD